MLTDATPTSFCTFKLGLTGWRAEVCQIALNSHWPSPDLVVDGDIGPKTVAAIKELQAALHLLTDGIAGPITQSAFVAAKCRHAQKGNTPPGLLYGQCQEESSGQWACVSEVHQPNTDEANQDFGVTQVNHGLPVREEALVRDFNPETSILALAAEDVDAHGKVLRWAREAGHTLSAQRAWELAALCHNWPAAAEALAQGKGAGWEYKETGTDITRKLSDPAPWIPNGWTGVEYVDDYIAKATAYVTSWTVA